MGSSELAEAVVGVGDVEAPDNRVGDRFRSVGIVAGRLALIVSSMAAVRLYTELLSPAEIGRMNLMLSLYQWFSLLILSPVGLFVLRYCIAWAQAGTLRLNLNRVSTYYVLVAASAAVIVALVQATVGWGFRVSPLWLAWLIGGHLLFIVSLGTNALCLNNLGRSWWFVSLNNVGAWLGIAAGAYLAWSLGRTAEYWLTGLLVGQAVAWAVSIFVLRGMVRGWYGPARDHAEPIVFSLRDAWAFAAPIVPITLAYWCQTDGFRFVLQHRAQTADVGLFTVAFTLGGTPLLAVERMLVDLLSPAFYRQTASRDRATMQAGWEEYASRLFPCVVVCTALIIGCATLMGHVLLSEKFWNVAVYAAYGALFRGCFVVVGALLLWTHAVEKTGSPLLAYASGAVVALVGVYVLSAQSVMHGTGLALLAAALCTMLMVYLRLWNLYGIVLPWRRLALALAISLPLLGIGVLVGPSVSSMSRSAAVAILLLPLGYCAAACAVFSGLVTPRQRSAAS